MKKCYVDANVLVYFYNSASPQHVKAKDILTKLVKEQYQIFLSSLTIDEYLHSIVRFSGIPRTEMKAFLKKGLMKVSHLPQIALINPPQEIRKHFRVIDAMVEYNLRTRDAYHLFTMKANRIKYFATFDNDFAHVFTTGTIKKVA